MKSTLRILASLIAVLASLSACLKMEDNEKFVGFDTLVDHLSESHRYYSIPDEIVLGKQCVEAVFDVDGFDVAIADWETKFYENNDDF